MKAFIFSGLGADHRVFEHIDFGTYTPEFIPWKSVDAKETLNSYAKKMSASFPENEPFLLLGISFGGILAQEVGKLFPQARILLIASVKTRHELTTFMRISGKLHLDKIAPLGSFFKNKKLNYWFFGAKHEAEKRVLSQILADTDPIFTRWAIGEIIRWKKNDYNTNPLKHVHGEADRIFPIRRTHPDICIPDGAHLMTVSQPEILSEKIQLLLNELAGV